MVVIYSSKSLYSPQIHSTTQSLNPQTSLPACVSGVILYLSTSSPNPTKGWLFATGSSHLPVSLLLGDLCQSISSSTRPQRVITNCLGWWERGVT